MVDIERGEEQGERHESVCCSRQSIGVLTFLVIIGILLLVLIFSELIPEGHPISFGLIILILSSFLILGCISWVTLVSLLSDNCVF